MEPEQDPSPDVSREAKEVVFLYSEVADCVLGVGVGSSAVSIEDSRSLWDQIWENRNLLTEICHSHPIGPSHLSTTDLETAAAVVAALGKPLFFSVVSPKGYRRRLVEPAGRYTEHFYSSDTEPWFVELLWALSRSFKSGRVVNPGRKSRHEQHDHRNKNR